MKNYKNFSFDVGMTSLGIAVNENGKIIHGDVLLMHPNAGSVKAQAGRRRLFRTREAHKAREAVLERLWVSIGKKPLQRKRFRKEKDAKGKRTYIKTKADERLEREFPGEGDDTVYASSLLRIMLLEGNPLEDWQIYKALHASIQRRGYDAEVPWKNQPHEHDESDKKENEENPEEKIDKFNNDLRKMTSDQRYHLPCYYDAWKMGLWDNQTKKIIHICQQPRFQPKEGEHAARGYTASRELVTREIKQLINRAAEQIPELKNHLTENNLDELLYGTQRNARYKCYPSALKIDGLLGQKYPRFKNRIVSKCALIPRLNVCKAEKQLAIEVGFLLRLVNWRYEKIDEQGEKSVPFLTSQQVADKFDECKSAWEKKQREYKPEEYAKSFKLTRGKVEKMAECLGGSVKTGHEDIPPSKHAGRSRFSQPALYLMKSLILSKKTPQGFYEELSQSIATAERKNPGAKFGYQLFSDVPYKYFADDFKFLEKMGNTRESIHVPDMSLAERYNSEVNDNKIKDADKKESKQKAIRKVINSCNWPELRHRLNVFHLQLEKLAQQYGKPDAVHIEFIREDFLSKKKKQKYTNQADKGKKSRQDAIETLKSRNISVTEKNILRKRLYEEQNHMCLYTGDSIDISYPDNYDIDHIFPQEDGGPDAYYNKVITSPNVNRKQKGKRLPCECDFINWPAFKNRLDKLKLGKNKKKLLLASTRAEAKDLIEKYTGLSGTAYIARLARDIVCLRFGWQPGAKDEQQRVFVFSGGLTSKVAKKYHLYKALGDGSKKYLKDRSDHRHHALDAMVISYLRQWARDKNKTDLFKLPKGIDADYFSEKLKDVYPRYTTKIRPALADQPKKIIFSNEGKKKIYYIKKKSGKKKEKVDIKSFKNISKDPDERGQWYNNHKKNPGGTSQHGYLFYIDANDNKVRSKTIHSFRSPHGVKKEIEKKASKVIGMFYSGKSIHLPEQNKITATQFGRSAWLKYGEYEIITINKNEVIIGATKQQHDQDKDATSRYRISSDNLKKIMVCNELIGEKIFDLSKLLIEKDEVLAGAYKVNNSNSNFQKFSLVNTRTGEETLVDCADLANHLAKEGWGSAFREKDTVTINNRHRAYIGGAKTDNLSEQILPEGCYRIQGFEGGAKKVKLVAQNGTIYRMNSKILAYFISDI